MAIIIIIIIIMKSIQFWFSAVSRVESSRVESHESNVRYLYVPVPVQWDYCADCDNYTGSTVLYCTVLYTAHALYSYLYSYECMCRTITTYFDCRTHTHAHTHNSFLFSFSFSFSSGMQADGNKAFKTGKYSDALRFYSKALACVASIDDNASPSSSSSSSVSMRCMLHNNRALCYLKLKVRRTLCAVSVPVSAA